MGVALSVKNISKNYKDVTAVAGVSLTVNEGELISLLGENGAGKSTLIKMLCGLVPPSGGDAEIFGASVVGSVEKIRSFTGIAPQETAVMGGLTVKENLRFVCGLYGFDRQKTDEKCEEIINLFGLNDYALKRAARLSGGMQRRLGIAMAIISEPKILFLDEPTVGLDVRARKELWEVIVKLKESNVTVFLTTHYMEEAEALSDRVAIMDRGKIIADGTTEEIKRFTGKQTLEDAYLVLTEERV